MAAVSNPASERVPTIALQLDGQTHQAPAGGTLAELVAAIGHAPQAVGTAVNGRFVARTERTGRVLQPGDEVLFFQPIVGG